MCEGQCKEQKKNKTRKKPNYKQTVSHTLKKYEQPEQMAPWQSRMKCMDKDEKLHTEREEEFMI